MKEYNIYGRIMLNIDFDVEAENEKEALLKARAEIESHYHLYINPEQEDMHAIEIQYES